MRRSGNIFESDCYRRRRFGDYSGNQILTIALSVISLIAVIYIIVDFDKVTAKIAVGIVNLLSMGLPVLAVIIGIMIMAGRFSRRRRRSFWGW
jgi:hypothetical protein